MRVRVTVAAETGDLNQAPSFPALNGPADSLKIALGGDPSVAVTFDWNESEDPEGLPVTYTWELSADESFDDLLHSEVIANGTQFEMTVERLAGILATQGFVTESPSILWYRIKVSDGVQSNHSGLRTLLVYSGATTATETVNGLPEMFALRGNYPNPFTFETAIIFDLPHASRVSLEVFDVAGRKVLHRSPEPVLAGMSRRIRIDGASFSAGIYLYRLVADHPKGRHEAVGRLTHLK